MKTKDLFEGEMDIVQEKSGAIVIVFNDKKIQLDKSDAEKYPLCNIENFNRDAYLNFYERKGG